MAPGKPVKKGILVPLLIISGYYSILFLENNLGLLVSTTSDQLLLNFENIVETPNRHSHKQAAALLTAAFSKPGFSHLSHTKTLYFYSLASGQLQLQTPFWHPNGVGSQELLFKF